MFALLEAIDNIKFKLVQNNFTRTNSPDLQRNSSKGLFHKNYFNITTLTENYLIRTTSLTVIKVN